MTPEQYDEQKKQLEEQLRKLRDYFIDSIAKFRVGEKVRVLGAYSREDVVVKRSLNCEHWNNRYYEGTPYEIVYVLQGAHSWGAFEREENLQKIEPKEEPKAETSKLGFPNFEQLEEILYFIREEKDKGTRQLYWKEPVLEDVKKFLEQKGFSFYSGDFNGTTIIGW